MHTPAAGDVHRLIVKNDRIGIMKLEKIKMMKIFNIRFRTWEMNRMALFCLLSVAAAVAAAKHLFGTQKTETRNGR